MLDSPLVWALAEVAFTVADCAGLVRWRDISDEARGNWLAGARRVVPGPLLFAGVYECDGKPGDFVGASPRASVHTNVIRIMAPAASFRGGLVHCPHAGCGLRMRALDANEVPRSEWFLERKELG